MAKSKEIKAEEVTPVAPINQSVDQASVQPPVNGKSNVLKIFLIILGVLLFLCCICSSIGYFILAKTDSDVKRRLNEVYGTTENAKPKATGTITPFPSGSDSESSFGDDATVPAGFPSDAPLYTSNTKLNAATYDSARNTYTLNYTTSDTTEQVATFYRSEIPAKGWKIEDEQTIFGNTFTAKKDNREMTIFIFGLGKSTNYSITVTK
jgi:hypothetical protein